MARTLPCPNCLSERTKRGGPLVWIVYLILIGLAVPAALLFELNAAIVGGIMLAVIVIAHLVLDQRLCLDCGQHWRGRAG
jgi:hypothetical protein